MPEHPYLPDRQSIHVLVIHFPLVLLFVAPVLGCFAAFTRGQTRRTLLTSAICLTALGTGCLYAAFESGRSAALQVNAAEVQNILVRHFEYASVAVRCFTLSMLLLALCLLLSKLLRLALNELSLLLPLGVTAFYALGLLWLVHAAYNGERLVHEFGVGRIEAP